jgi:hypothetical protein
VDHQFQQNITGPDRYRFGVLGLFIVLFVILLAAVIYWVAAAGFREAIESTGFQYLGLAAIIVGLGAATRVTARLLESRAVVDKQDVAD